MNQDLEGFESGILDAIPSSSAEGISLLGLFECPVCLDYATPPVNQCRSGHVLCKHCLKQVNHCPTCRIPLNGTIRNLSLDKIASSIEIQCKNVGYGCHRRLLLTTKEDHEKECLYEPYGCPIEPLTCSWGGSNNENDVLGHIELVHPEVQFLGNAYGSDVEFSVTNAVNILNENERWVKVQHFAAFGSPAIFLLQKFPETPERRVEYFATLQLIGSKMNTQKLAHRISVCGFNRRYCFEGPMESIHKKRAHNPTATNLNGLFFTQDIAVFFSEEEIDEGRVEGTLTFNIMVNEIE